MTSEISLAVGRSLASLQPVYAAESREFRAFADEGLLAVALPHSRFGVPAARAGAELIRAIARAGELGLGASLMAEAFTIAPLIHKVGTELHRVRYLEPMLRGELIGCIALTEPTGGSDVVRAIQTTARLVDGRWVLNGEKLFITNGPVADFAVVLARTTEAASPIGLSLFIVDLRAPGVRVADTLDKVGLRSSHTAQLTFENVIVDERQLLGRQEMGYLAVMGMLTFERLLIAVAALEAADRAIELFEENGGDPALVRDLVTELELNRRFIDSIIAESDDQPPAQLPANIAKLITVEIGQRVFPRLGRHLFSVVDQQWFESVRRDIRVLSVFAGSSETMTEQISASMVRNGLRVQESSE